MAKFIQSVCIALIVSVAVCSASPARTQRLKQSKSRFLARQEVAEDVPAQTPYPPAGIKPEIPFSLPTDEKLVAPVNYYLPPLEAAPAKFYSPPSQVYGPPAQTYGPPEVGVKDEVEEVAEDEPVQPPQEQPEEQKPEEAQPAEPQPEEAQPEEAQPEQAEEVAPPQQPEEEEQGDDSVQTEPEEKVPEVDQAAVEEDANNAISARVVLAKNNGRKSAKLRSAKLQLLPAASPLRRRAVAAQPIYLVGGSLYTYNGQLLRL